MRNKKPFPITRIPTQLRAAPWVFRILPENSAQLHKHKLQGPWTPWDHNITWSILSAALWPRYPASLSPSSYKSFPRETKCQYITQTTNNIIHLQCRKLPFNSWVGKICWRRGRLLTPVFWGFTCVAQLVKNLPTMWETWVRSLGWEDSLEKGKGTHSSILAWRIPWTV